MTIEHCGSGQRFVVQDVQPYAACAGFSWRGRLAGSADAYLHSFNAPAGFPVIVIDDPERDAEDAHRAKFQD
jgi:hypothetical protein